MKLTEKQAMLLMTVLGDAVRISTFDRSLTTQWSVPYMKELYNEIWKQQSNEVKELEEVVK